MPSICVVCSWRRVDMKVSQCIHIGFSVLSALTPLPPKASLMFCPLMRMHNAVSEKRAMLLYLSICLLCSQYAQRNCVLQETFSVKVLVHCVLNELRRFVYYLPNVGVIFDHICCIYIGTLVVAADGRRARGWWSSGVPRGRKSVKVLHLKKISILYACLVANNAAKLFGAVLSVLSLLRMRLNQLVSGIVSSWC